MDFAQQLRKIREDNCIPQARMAEAVGVDVTYISKMENGKMPPPSEEVILKIAETFCVDENDLIFSAGKIPSDIAEVILSSPEVRTYLKQRASKKVKSDKMDNDPNEIRKEVMQKIRGNK